MCDRCNDRTVIDEELTRVLDDIETSICVTCGFRASIDSTRIAEWAEEWCEECGWRCDRCQIEFTDCYRCGRTLCGDCFSFSKFERCLACDKAICNHCLLEGRERIMFTLIDGKPKEKYQCPCTICDWCDMDIGATLSICKRCNLRECDDCCIVCPKCYECVRGANANVCPCPAAWTIVKHFEANRARIEKDEALDS